MNIQKIFCDAVLTKTTGATVTATFKNGSSGHYLKESEMLYMLKTESGTVDIIDDETGEVIYINEKNNIKEQPSGGRLAIPAEKNKKILMR